MASLKCDFWCSPDSDTTRTWLDGSFVPTGDSCTAATSNLYSKTSRRVALGSGSSNTLLVRSDGIATGIRTLALFGAERAVDHSRFRLDGPSLAIEQREANMTATRIGTIRKIGLTLGLALSISTVATLSSFAFSSKARQMCTGDALRLCSSEIPNIARITACMVRNKANVSQGCRAVMEEEGAAASKATAAAKPVEQPAATKTKPVQAPRVEPKPTPAAPVERSAATEAKPVQAAPFEQKPTAAAPVEQSAATEAKPVQAAPFEQKRTTATPVEQPAATEAKPVEATLFDPRPTTATPVEQSAATEARSVQAAPVEPKPTTAAPVEQSAATQARSVQAAPFEPRPSIATPVEQPAATQARSVQAAPVERKPTTATAVEAMPVEAKSTPKGKPEKLAQRKQKYRQQTAERHHRDFRNMEWIIGFALSMPFYW